MNYVLVMTEGKVELEFLKLLQDRNLLIFEEKSLLFEDMYHARQLDGKLLNYIQQTSFDSKIIIYRIGDKMTDELKISPKLIKTKIESQVKVCTLPEFEILLIINENLKKEFDKSQKKASEFIKSKFKTNTKQSGFVSKYFGSMSDAEIINLLKRYSELKKKPKDCLTLYDLIKK